MDTPPQEPSVKLLPLIEGGANEKVANMLTRLIGDNPQAATSALIVLMGLDAFLKTGDPETVAVFWEPLIIVRKLKKEFGGQAYRKALEKVAEAHNKDAKTYTVYKDACQILLHDPEQEKIAVDPAL